MSSPVLFTVASFTSYSWSSWHSPNLARKVLRSLMMLTAISRAGCNSNSVTLESFEKLLHRERKSEVAVLPEHGEDHVQKVRTQDCPASLLQSRHYWPVDSV